MLTITSPQVGSAPCREVSLELLVPPVGKDISLLQHCGSPILIFHQSIAGASMGPGLQEFHWNGEGGLQRTSTRSLEERVQTSSAQQIPVRGFAHPHIQFSGIH